MQRSRWIFGAAASFTLPKAVTKRGSMVLADAHAGAIGRCGGGGSQQIQTQKRGGAFGIAAETAFC